MDPAKTLSQLIAEEKALGGIDMVNEKNKNFENILDQLSTNLTPEQLQQLKELTSIMVFNLEFCIIQMDKVHVLEEILFGVSDIIKTVRDNKTIFQQILLHLKP